MQKSKTGYMVTKKSIKNALREAVTSQVYARGVAYYKNRKVKNYSSQEQKDNLLTITGKVKGGKMYTVTLEFNTKDEEFWELSCTCPYGDICKHAVPWGLPLRIH